MMKTNNAVFRCTKCGNDFKCDTRARSELPPCPKCNLAVYVRFVGWESDDAVAQRNQSL